MSWTRAHVERLELLQKLAVELIEDIGTDAPGVDSLIESNECMANARNRAVIQIDQHRLEARQFAEALRDYAVEDNAS